MGIDLRSNSKDAATSHWKEGDQMIVVHNAGGVKSETYGRDSKLGSVLAGHFSYGYATIVRDALTDQLRFDITYIQTYGTTTFGVISGAAKRQCVVGSLHLGYLGLRAVSDCLIKMDLLSDEYKIGKKMTLCPLKEFKMQFHIMTARYRVGDGHGMTDVGNRFNSAIDANQSLYVAIDKFEDMVERKTKQLAERNASNRKFDRVIMEKEDEVQFKRLKVLGKQLHAQLAPFGIVRADWEDNARNIASVKKKRGNVFTTIFNSFKPRRIFDRMLKIFVNNDAKLWFITTAVVGGDNRGVVPLAPKKLLSNV